MRALITGISGFVGGHLTNLLRQEGFEVWGIDTQSPPARIATGAVAVKQGDVCDRTLVARVVRDAQPTHVFHLATSYRAIDDPQFPATDSNVVSATVLLEELSASTSPTRVMIASSSAVYGNPDRQLIDEDAPANPTTAYGSSKLAMETAAASFRATRGLDIVVVRTFNLLGPGMPRRLFAGSLAAQIAAAEHGGSAVIKVGRLDSSRDYIDVRDAVRAYAVLVCQPTLEHWVFNVCSGLSRSCRELADGMLALARVPITLDYDASRLQSGDVDHQQGLATRIRGATGWMPRIDFSSSVRDTLDHERKRPV